jgi:TetR/AcrR family transcriptional regulator
VAAYIRKESDMLEKHYKDTFERISSEKRERILSTAIDEFSSNGFDRANVNVIARKAGISIGLIYRYFDTKEDLFLTCLDYSFETLESVISSTISSETDPLTMAEKLIRAIQFHSRENSKFTQLYNEITGDSKSEYVDMLADKIEGISAKAYTAVIENAKQQGLVREDCDPRIFAFCFDSLLTTLQFSYSCEYYKKRFQIYCGDDIFDNDEKVVQQMLSFLRSAFEAK